ncbi:hypothetical protein [Streptomyces sp. NPDC058247]|uniref:hypothetical protein n=1 Tax=Streptomyces sp. NPDC058247 TaxID=3346401 RepID=UPI0036EA4F2F
MDPAVVYGVLARLRQSGAAVGCGGHAVRRERIDLAAELRTCTSKKAALTVLYRERIKLDDSRSLNAIAEHWSRSWPATALHWTEARRP